MPHPLIELARLHKPAGALLILWPFIWGLTMVARSNGTPFRIFFRDLVGGCLWFFFLRGAGCIWNDIVDSDLDKQVERTKHRPLPSGRASISEALWFLLVHLVGLSVSIVLTGNMQLSYLAFITVVPLAGGYPFIKRYSYWPQAWLGMAFNTGTLMSWSWMSGDLSHSSIALASAGWFWTLWYDTIYGHQDKKDDMRVGIRSTALLFNSRAISKLFLAVNGVMFVVCLTIAGVSNGVEPFSPYYSIGVGGAILHLSAQLWYLKLDSPSSCWYTFCSNGFVLGPTVALGLFLDYLLVVAAPSWIT
ncbi:UbiA prenyltransferase [Mycena polygramma]|nr:UbiA prenyltransferase [Mycena polygramma]